MTLKRFGLETDFFDEQPDVLDVKAGVNWFIAASRTGYREELQEAKEANIPSKNINATLQRVRIFTAGNISYSLSQIEKHVFDWASSSYVQLQYGNKVKDIWELYRSVVDNAVQQLGLTNHLSAIHDGIKTDNPESWRATVLECRNLLNDLANILWQDPKATYEHLLGSGVDGKLDVRQGNYSNRISAYLHQKSVTGTMGKFLRDEAERLSVSIRSLIAVESAAHEPIDKLLANTVILSTYFLIGELAQKTDLLPVTEYGPVN